MTEQLKSCDLSYNRAAMRSSWLKARRYGYQTNDCASDGSTRHEQIQAQYIITVLSAFLFSDPCPTSPNGFQARNPKLADIRHLGSDCSCVDTASCINFFCFCFFFCLRCLTRLRNAKQSGSSTEHISGNHFKVYSPNALRYPYTSNHPP